MARRPPRCKCRHVARRLTLGLTTRPLRLFRPPSPTLGAGTTACSCSADRLGMATCRAAWHGMWASAGPCARARRSGIPSGADNGPPPGAGGTPSQPSSNSPMPRRGGWGRGRGCCGLCHTHLVTKTRVVGRPRRKRETCKAGGKRCWEVVSAGCHSDAAACTMSCTIRGDECGRGTAGASRGEHTCARLFRIPRRPCPEGRLGRSSWRLAVGLLPIVDGGSRRGPHQTVAACAMRTVLVGFPHGPGPFQPPGCSDLLARPSRMVASGT
jgi:hypothetical protein